MNTQRGSQSSIAKRRGKKEIAVTRRRGGGVKTRETNLTSDQVPKFSPQPGTPKEIQRVGQRREGVGGDRDDLGEKKENQKGREK